MHRHSYILIISFFFFGPPSVYSNPPELDEAKELLKKANIATDDLSLLNYFRQRTAGEADFKKLSQLIPQLGASDFSKRERASADLLQAGQASLPFLKDALNDADPEIVRRARQLTDFLAQGGFADQTCAVCTVVQYQKPA